MLIRHFSLTSLSLRIFEVISAVDSSTQSDPDCVCVNIVTNQGTGKERRANDIPSFLTASAILPVDLKLRRLSCGYKFRERNGNRSIPKKELENCVNREILMVGDVHYICNCPFNLTCNTTCTIVLFCSARIPQFTRAGL